MHTRQLRPLHITICAATTLLMTLPLGSTLLAQSPAPQTAAQRAAQSQRRLLAPNIKLVAPALHPARHQQLKTTKRRADLNALRAATWRAQDGSLRHKISATKSVVLLDQSTLDQMRHITPSLRPVTQAALDRYRDYVLGKANAVTTPASVSLKRRQTPVQDQGARGTCVAFAIVAAIEAAYNANGQYINLSEEDAYSTLKLGRSCQDGTFLEIFQLGQLSSYGISLESDWPYTKDPRDLGCPRATIPRPARAAQNAKWAPTRYISIPSARGLSQDAGDVANNPRQIESWLATGHEVYIAVGVAANLGQRGVIDVELDERGEPIGSWAGHSMLIVGYDKANGGTFTVKNSWGTGVGDGGYITLSYDYIRTYAKNASILPELRDVAANPSRAAQFAPTITSDSRSIQPLGRSTPDTTLPSQARPNAPKAVVTLPPGNLNSAQRARTTQLGDQLRQLNATKAQAAGLRECALIETRREGNHTYERTIPLWRVSLSADLQNHQSAQTFDCRANQPCITYSPAQGAPNKAPSLWVHASILSGGTPEQVSQQRAQAVNLWRQLIAACTPQGDRA